MSNGSLVGSRAGRRPWYEWIVWALWLVSEVFLMQNAVASGQELEPRASMIFWILFAVVLIGGVIVWFTRRARLLKT